MKLNKEETANIIDYISDKKETLYQAIDKFIDGCDIHLGFTDIGKVLVKLANSYLNG